ncbi:MAG: ABC transporter ATP-binding protein [Acidobacteriota bacterium]|nr:ABC transporter ATP-binding protein [Acidobacteriota bacterium]
MIRTLSAHLGKYGKYVLLCVMLMTGDVICTMLVPTLMGRIVDVGVAGRDMRYIERTGALMVLLSLTCIGLGAFNAKFSARAAQGFGANLRKALFDKIQSFSFSNIDHFSAPSLVTRLTSDVGQMQNTLLMCLRMLLRAPLMLVSATFFAVSINARLSLVLVVAIPLLVLGIALILRQAERLFTAMQARIDGLNGTVQENLIAIRVVKAFVREPYEKLKFQKSNDELTAAAIRAGNLISMVFPMMIFIMNGAMIAVIWLGGRMVHAGGMGTGQLLSYISYIMEILFSIIIFSMVFILFARAEACGKRIVEVLNTDIDIVDKEALPDPEKTPKVREGRIEFRDVDFKYGTGGGGKNVLSGINLTVEPGEFVAVVGGTGSGKTSLVNLIPRLYDVSGGRLLVDGVDVRDYRIEDLRAGIGMVLQKNVLFSGTIRENLLWGDGKAGGADVVEAARIAQADGFIRGFPDGYETVLGQGGVNVSGGQKQRLCIARAMLKKPAILILDDSTSAIDTATEARIRAEFTLKLKGTTVLMIAQRIGSVMDADRIVVLDDGQVAGVGTHAELLLNNAIYREICGSQQEGLTA